MRSYSFAPFVRIHENSREFSGTVSHKNRRDSIRRQSLRLRENVADFAEKPSHVRYHGAEPYTVQEISNLLQLTAAESIAVPIFLAAFYGLRRSELLGLR